MLAEAGIVVEGVRVGVPWGTGCLSAAEIAVGHWASYFGGTRT